MAHVQVEASVTRPEHALTTITNTFNFQFTFDLRKGPGGACLPPRVVLPTTGVEVRAHGVHLVDQCLLGICRHRSMRSTLCIPIGKTKCSCQCSGAGPLLNTACHLLNFPTVRRGTGVGGGQILRPRRISRALLQDAVTSCTLCALRSVRMLFPSMRLVPAGTLHCTRQGGGGIIDRRCAGQGVVGLQEGQVEGESRERE